jgi:hypothetical protein
LIRSSTRTSLKRLVISLTCSMVAYLDGVVDKVVDDDTGNRGLVAVGRRDENQRAPQLP